MLMLKGGRTAAPTVTAGPSDRSGEERRFGVLGQAGERPTGEGALTDRRNCVRGGRLTRAGRSKGQSHGH